MRCKYCKVESDSVEYTIKGMTEYGRLFLTPNGEVEEWKADGNENGKTMFYCRSCRKEVPNPIKN